MFFWMKKGFLSQKDGGFETERSVSKSKAKPLPEKPAQDAPGSAETGWRPLAGRKRLEAESPLLRNGRKLPVNVFGG
jgi:hypothetical protein